MDDFEKENAGNDLEVDIADLDAPDKAQNEWLFALALLQNAEAGLKI